MQRIGLAVAVGVVATIAVACGGSSGGGSPSSPGGTSGLTYYHDIKPIIDAKCLGCHVQGGLGPFPLVTASDVTTHASLIKTFTSSRQMPPWLAAPGCQTYEGDPSLTDAQIQTIAKWADSGASAGDPSSVGAPLAVDETQLSRVDSTLTMAASYTPAIHPDDYHCFLLDWPEAATKYITGFRARAGDAAIVHHVIAFLAPPSTAATYEQLNAGGAGWTCFGGPGGDGNGASLQASWVGSWAPGSTGGDFPTGTGIKVQPGSKIVLQVHYNTLSTTGTEPTSLDFKLDDSVAKEAAIVPYTNPQWLQGAMQIPAGNPDVEYAWAFDVSPYMSLITNGVIPNGAFTIYGAALHMHLLGTEISTAIGRGDGSGDACLLNIPAWNFHWQRMYPFAQPITYNPGDKLKIDCHWNNSQANQPYVNGQQLPPKNVAWGEGTTDEMCLGLMYVTAP